MSVLIGFPLKGQSKGMEKLFYRGLAEYGDQPGWLEESDPAGVMDGPYRLPFPYRTVPVALRGAAQLRADGISSCCYVVNVHNRPS